MAINMSSALSTIYKDFKTFDMAGDVTGRDKKEDKLVSFIDIGFVAGGKKMDGTAYSAQDIAAAKYIQAHKAEFYSRFADPNKRTFTYADIGTAKTDPPKTYTGSTANLDFGYSRRESRLLANVFGFIDASQGTKNDGNITKADITNYVNTNRTALTNQGYGATVEALDFISQHKEVFDAIDSFNTKKADGNITLSGLNNFILA